MLQSQGVLFRGLLLVSFSIQHAHTHDISVSGRHVINQLNQRICLSQRGMIQQQRRRYQHGRNEQKRSKMYTALKSCECFCEWLLENAFLTWQPIASCEPSSRAQGQTITQWRPAINTKGGKDFALNFMSPSAPRF